MIIEVVCAFVARQGRLLLARRADNGLWELPGGKLERGETPEAGLTREIAEEMDCTVRVGLLRGRVREDLPDGTMRLSAYDCRLESGNPQPLEHSELVWAEVGELAEFELAPADRRLLSSLDRPWMGRTDLLA